MKKLKMVLASSSPRRKELLGWLKVPIEIIPSAVEEITSETRPCDVVVDLARLKGRDILGQINDEESFIVASDTIVVINDEILGKPKNKENARQMLTKLSGRSHQVFTAVYMGVGSEEHTFYMKSDVTFASITPDLMELYLEGDESLDKAGAYGIQGEGLTFVSNLNGSYSNVVGFPLANFIIEMKSFLTKLGYNKDEWREIFS